MVSDPRWRVEVCSKEDSRMTEHQYYSRRFGAGVVNLFDLVFVANQF